MKTRQGFITQVRDATREEWGHGSPTGRIVRIELERVSLEAPTKYWEFRVPTSGKLIELAEIFEKLASTLRLENERIG